MTTETNHGKLHSMRIEIYPGKDCLIREIVGNLNEPRTFNLGETILILVRFTTYRKCKNTRWAVSLICEVGESTNWKENSTILKWLRGTDCRSRKSAWEFCFALYKCSSNIQSLRLQRYEDANSR